MTAYRMHSHKSTINIANALLTELLFVLNNRLSLIGLRQQIPIGEHKVPIGEH